MPRLPGKPVQNMPPSPHRQGRRGYDSAWPIVSWQNMFVPAMVTSLSFFCLMLFVFCASWGMGVFLAPVLAPFFAVWGIHWSGNVGRVTYGQACRFAIFMSTMVAAIPTLCVVTMRDKELVIGFFVLLGVTVLTTMAGALFAASGTRKPRPQPCLEF